MTGFFSHCYTAKGKLEKVYRKGQERLEEEFEVVNLLNTLKDHKVLF